MDLDEWEYIPDEGFLEIHDDGGNKIFSRNKHWKIDPNIMFKDYFKDPQFVDSTDQKPNFPNQIIPIPVKLHPPNQEQVKQRIEIPIPIPITTKPIKIESQKPEPIKTEDDLELGSQIFFKKTKENHEFVDMKMDSPRSGNRGIVGESMEMKKELRSSNEGLNLWKWGLSGIGAICSFGVVAATVCIIILGTGNKQSRQHKIRFHVYQDDSKRRINEVVHNTNKLNEAISAAKGVPLSRAHITFGGYLDAL